MTQTVFNPTSLRGQALFGVIFNPTSPRGQALFEAASQVHSKAQFLPVRCLA